MQVYEVVHLIAHALGMWHTHQRDDRDDHVMFIADNLQVRWLRENVCDVMLIANNAGALTLRHYFDDVRFLLSPQRFDQLRELFRNVFGITKKHVKFAKNGLAIG